MAFIMVQGTVMNRRERYPASFTVFAEASFSITLRAIGAWSIDQTISVNQFFERKIK
jgi:hypothetical protein